MKWLKQNWLKLVILLFLLLSIKIFLYKSYIKNTPQQKTTTQEFSNTQQTPTISQNNSTKTQASYIDGYIEPLNENHGGIKGWAFDNNKPLTINLTFREINTGLEGTLTGNGDAEYGSDGDFYFTFRNDIEEFVKNQGIEPSVRTGFQLNQANGGLPKGDYRLIKATYNNRNFKILAPETIYHFEHCYLSNGSLVCE